MHERSSRSFTKSARLSVATLLGLACLLFGQAPAAFGAGAAGTAAAGQSAAMALTVPQTQTLKLLHFNMAGGAKNNGTYPIIGRIIREVQERRPDVISLNEVCDRQYAHLLIQLEAIGYSMQGYFQESRTIVPDCIVPPDTRNEAGNAVLVRGTLVSDQGYMFTSDHKLEAREQPTITESRSVACVTALFSIANQPVKACSTHLAPKESGAANPYAAPEAEAKELARVFGPEASAGSFILMGDLNLQPGNPALSSLYAPEAGTTGQFWEVDMHFYCDEEFCDGPVQGGDPSHAEGKIDYTFVSRKHFSFEHQNVQMVDAGNCDDHPCSDHKLFRSEVYLHQTTTPYGTMRNTHSNKCMTVTGTVNNAAAVQFTCNTTSTDYRWRFEHAWWGEYVLRKENGGRCLRLPSSANVGAVQTTCDANNTLQRWNPRYPTADMLRNVGSGKCLAVTNTVNNSAVIQTNCSTTAVPQRWTHP
ncbi:ricin-type beta-trefoil lectin domain protein [Sphaerisporangium sp. TRM90804]|uniref:ricin-type beta-trefoil lectin domain protein n=1 Tax=Sphaerisporangium sp. TRM90804 TaxID=3031113 RepID=UPI002449D31D|nr:ricin-type beta-trefoil lectin domain protein [Sphaerisporangium sp. TRM90804]MDH2426220.1 ricin-type beta-trefoil lectin domain protein [Sphaerisporangium sp. TRM90804]